MAYDMNNISPLAYIGLGLLANSGPSTQPRPLGAGLLQGLQMAQQGQALQNQAKLQGMLAEKTQMELAQAKDRQAALSGLFGGYDPQTGITWETGRQQAQTPATSALAAGTAATAADAAGVTPASPQPAANPMAGQMGLLTRAFPEQMAGAAMKAMVPDYQVVEGKILNMKNPSAGFLRDASGKVIDAKGAQTEIGKALADAGITPDNPAYGQIMSAQLQKMLVQDGVQFGPNGAQPFQPAIQAAAQRAGAEALAQNPALIARAGGVAAAETPALVERAGRVAEAQNPAMIERAGGVANAQLPAQRAMAAHNANLDIQKAGPMAQARLAAENAPVAVDIPGMGETQVPAGKVGEVYAKQSEIAGKKQQGAQNVLELLNKAEPILTKATGSMSGATLDSALGAFGISTPGANATAQLKALEGALIMNMPRLEGPQSNTDLRLYSEAAGKIGDPWTPVEQRKAAIQTVRGIYSKYAGGQGGSTAAPAGGNDPLGIR